MTVLKTRLHDDLLVNLKKRDELRVSTLRLVLGAIQVAEKSEKSAGELDDAQTQAVIRTEVKKRRGTAETWVNAGQTDRAVRETAEADFLSEYLPQQLTEDEVKRIVDEVIATADTRNFGQVMKLVSAKIKGLADGKTVAQIVRTRCEG